MNYLKEEMNLLVKMSQAVSFRLQATSREVGTISMQLAACGLKPMLSVLMVTSIAFSATAQSDYDKKLKSLYKNTVKTIQSHEVKELMAKKQKVILIDTRSKEEFKVSHLPGAQFLDYDSYSTNDLKKIPTNSKIIVYCSVGYRSERVGEKLLKLGYKDVCHIYGGIFEWKNEGHEVVNQLNHPTDSVHTHNKNWSKWLMKGVKVY